MGTAIAESRVHGRPGSNQTAGSFGEDFDRLAISLESQLDSLCAQILADCALSTPRYELPDADAGELPDLVRRTLVAEVRAMAMAHEMPQRSPVSDLGSRPALSLGVLLRAYRLTHMVLWRAWFDLVENASLEDGRRRDLLRRGSDFFFTYAGALSDLAAKDRRPVATHGEQRRTQAVESLLQGDVSAAATLGVDLGHHHIALISWGEKAPEAARAIAKLLRRPLLAVKPLGHEATCWAWLSSARALSAEEELAIRKYRPDGAKVAIGLEGAGEEGFRSSHRQALRARRFGTEVGPELLFYDSVAVEVLAIENEEDARAFVAHQLRGIEDDSVASRRIRETLGAYFAAEHNAASAGAALGVHQQTVANRLRAAEGRLGGAIGPRRVELEVALRLKACLDRS